MCHYKSFKNELNEGDKIITEVVWGGKIRTVTYTNGGILCNEYWFPWDSFFEINSPVAVVKDCEDRDFIF